MEKEEGSDINHNLKMKHTRIYLDVNFQTANQITPFLTPLKLHK